MTEWHLFPEYMGKLKKNYKWVKLIYSSSMLEEVNYITYIGGRTRGMLINVNIHF